MPRKPKLLMLKAAKNESLFLFSTSVSLLVKCLIVVRCLTQSVKSILSGDEDVIEDAKRLFRA